MNRAWKRTRMFRLFAAVALAAGVLPNASAQAQAPGATQMPAGAPSKAFQFPRAATKTLPNGLRVFVIPNSEQPSVSLRLVLTTAGAIHDPADKRGTAAMTAELLTQGTATRSAQQIAEAIDFVGGSLSAGADHDATYVNATVVKKDLALAMELLADVTLRASFQQEELERRRQQLLSALRVQYADPEYLASAIFDRLVYGNHSYGLPNEGTPASVAKLTRDDLVRFRDAYFSPQGALLAFAGDITPEAAFAAAEKSFGAWAKKADVPAAAPPAATSGRGLRILLVDKPDAVQAQIRVGRPGIRRNDSDYLPLLVTNRIFGGGFNSRLSTEVRIRKGLTYGAYSQFESRRLGGSFVAATSTRTEAAAEAAHLVAELIGKMAGGVVTKEELDFARDYLAGVFPIQSETPEQVAGRIVTVAQYGLPADYNDTYREKILGVGSEQVGTMARKHFAADDLQMVLVGNVEQFREALKKQFPGAKIEEMPAAEVDLLAADLRRAKEATPAATAETLERGRQFLLAAAEAAGGAALAGVQSIEWKSSGEVATPQGALAVDIHGRMVYPDKFHNEIRFAMGAMQQGFDGTASWLASPQGVMDLPPSAGPEMLRGIALLGGWGLLREALAGKVQAQFLGEQEFAGKKALAVEWMRPNEKVKLYFDAESRRLIGARYMATTLQGTFDTEQHWSDYRPVEGLQFPHRWVAFREGAKYSDFTVAEVKLNSKIDAGIFARPR